MADVNYLAMDQPGSPADMDKLNMLALGPMYAARGPVIGAGAGPVTPFDATPAVNRPMPPDNYLKPLDTHAAIMFRETAPSEAAEILPGRVTPPQGTAEKYLADHPDLALGQGEGAKGVQLAFDASKLQGQINKAKPTWSVGYQNGTGAEYVGKNTNDDYRGALVGVRVPNNMNLSKGDGKQVLFGLHGLLDQGWSASDLGNGYIEYLPPQAAP